MENEDEISITTEYLLLHKLSGKFKNVSVHNIGNDPACYLIPRYYISIVQTLWLVEMLVPRAKKNGHLLNGFIACLC